MNNKRKWYGIYKFLHVIMCNISGRGKVKDDRRANENRARKTKVKEKRR
jgi:hypothetical protein